MRKTLKPILKIVFITVMVVWGLIFANSKLRELGNEISGDYIVNLIREESNGLYELKFERLELNIVTKTLRLYNAALIPNFDALEDSSNVSNLYQVHIDSANIALKSVIKIYTENELVVEGVEVVNPQIRMTKINPEKKAIKFGRETGELYDIIEGYLDLLKIEYFRVRSGQINHYPTNLSLQAIDFNVNNFLIEQGAKQRKVFYSESINLGLGSQYILLPDSIHSLSFEGFQLSTKDSLLSFSNLKIQTRSHIDKEKTFTEDQKNIYDIIIPTVELKGVNYVKAYEDNHLIIEKVDIPEPIINIQSVSGADAESQEEVSDNTIGKSLLALFDVVKVKELQIDKAQLDLLVKTENQQQFRSNNISIALFNIQLDSSNQEINTRSNYFEDARISIQDYYYKLPDSLHQMAFERLQINTFNSSLKVENFTINPLHNYRDSSLTVFNFNIPLMKLEGINYQQALVEKRMFFDNMDFHNPLIEVEPAITSKASSETDSIFTPQVLQKLLQAYFEEIKAKKIQVTNGKVQIKNLLSLNEISLKLEGLVIDTASSSWHNLADSIELQTGPMEMNLGSRLFGIGKISAGKKLEQFELERVFYKDQTTADLLESQQLKLYGVQLDSMIKSRKIQVEHVSLSNPSITLYKKPSNETEDKINWKWPATPITVKVYNGSLTYHLDKINNLTVGSFNTEVSYLKKLRLKYLHSGKLKLHHAQSGHELRADSLYLPKDRSRLSLLNLQLSALEGKNNIKIAGNIPSIHFTGFQKEALLDKNSFLADSMIANIDDFNVNWISEAGNKLIRNKSENGISFELNTAHLRLKQALISFKTKDQKEFVLSNKNTTLSLSDLSYPKQKILSNRDLIFSRNLFFESNDVEAILFNGDSVGISNIYYNSLSRNGGISEFKYQQTTGKSHAEVKKIDLINWDLKKYVSKNELSIGKIAADEADILISLPAKREGSFQDKRYLPFKKIILNQLLAGKITLQIHDQEQNRKHYLNNVNLKLKSLQLDSVFHLKELHHSIAALKVSGKDYRENLGKHYTLKLGKYSFSYPEASLFVGNISMKSRYDRFKFSEHIKYQTDWFEVKAGSLTLSGIDLEKLGREELHIRKASINNSELTVFRDLAVPLDSSKYVPLTQESLQKINFPLFIDTVSVNTRVAVYIKPANNSGLGFLSFDDLQGAIYKVRSRPGYNNASMELFATGKLNKSGNFETKAVFPFPSKTSNFKISGSIGVMDLTKLNDMLVPIAAVEIRSGENETLNFTFSGNNDYARGIMNFRYDDLKVNILNSETYRSRGLSSSLVNFFANSFVVRGNNPNFFKFKEGSIYFRRDKSRSIFNFWAKSLLSGAVTSIGINGGQRETDEQKQSQGVD